MLNASGPVTRALAQFTPAFTLNRSGDSAPWLEPAFTTSVHAQIIAIQTARVSIVCPLSPLSGIHP